MYNTPQRNSGSSKINAHDAFYKNHYDACIRGYPVTGSLFSVKIISVEAP